MRVIVVGCGRVGAGIAERLAREGHQLTVIDVSSESFSRLEEDFSGQAIRGDGTDEDVLRRAGADEADMFFALTEGDNRNVLAAQLAAETFKIGRVVAKVNDPVRAEAYRALGMSTICRTRLLVDALGRYAGLPADPGADGVSAPTQPHHHHHAEGTATAAAAAGAPNGATSPER